MDYIFIDQIYVDIGKRLFESGIMGEFNNYIEPRDLALFVEILKHVQDDPNVFIHGKWAMIQFLQAKLEDQIKKYNPI